MRADDAYDKFIKKLAIAVKEEHIREIKVRYEPQIQKFEREITGLSLVDNNLMI